MAEAALHFALAAVVIAVVIVEVALYVRKVPHLLDAVGCVH